MSMHSIRLALVATVLGLSTAAAARRTRKARASALAGASTAIPGHRKAAGEARPRREVPVAHRAGPMVAEPA